VKDSNNTFWPYLDIDLPGAILIDFGLAEGRVRTASFRAARFHGRASIEKTNVTGDARFDRAQFSAFASFRGRSLHRRDGSRA
jgi:hypothetical protein